LATTSLIAIVDDDASVRKATASLLESHGYMTAVFGSAEDLLRSGRLPDTACLVTDLYMPGINGVDLQRRVIDGGYRIPTIFITAHTDGHMHAEALKCDAVARLLKPVSEQQLLSCIKDALKVNRWVHAQ
jgi:FixJ family two-component response regulator